MKACNLTDDLLVEILVRLPFKSLCRFKCVSKSWCRVISDNFLRQRLPPIVTGLFLRSESAQFKKARYAYTSSNGTVQDCNLNFFPFGEKSTVVHGANGLLLYFSSALRTYYVVNTGMKLWVSLPKAQKAAQLSMLAFDPYSSTDYRVVCFTAWRAQGAELEIYSSETGKWDQHEVKFGVEPDALSSRMHYFNSLLYIIANPNMIVAVNLKKISCNLIRLPEKINSLSHVGHCQGRLHYAHIDGNKLKIWMINYLNRSGWELKHEINLREII
ncbi:F-box protein [Rhynchospora pubera]|uniref:F-box protein n=1 Tax=Rhynchospora pubera TaxID=906938 RepID=A0AAV8CDD2_9POAL|nr:F-box protein [Rhynchospora pubera]